MATYIFLLRRIHFMVRKTHVIGGTGILPVQAHRLEACATNALHDL